MIFSEIVITDFWAMALGMLLANVVIQWIIWKIMGKNIITRQEVQDMIVDNIINKPEIQDMIEQRNSVINTELKHLIDAKNELTDAMRKTTDAVNQLKIELTTLREQHNRQ